MPKLLTYALRSLWARRTTTLATGAGIALLVFVLAASGMLASGMRHTIQSAGDPNRAVVMQHDVYSESGSNIDQSVFGRVAAAPGIKLDTKGQPLVTGELISMQLLGEVAEARLSTVQLRGVDENVLEVRPAARIVAGRAIRPGTAEAIAGRAIAERHREAAIGAKIELTAARSVEVVGIFESGGSVLESEIWVDLTSMRSSFGMEGKLSSVTAVLADPAGFDAFATPLTADKQVGLDVAKEPAYYEKVSGGMSEVIALLGVVEAFIFSLGAASATMIVFYGAVAQRRREVGVLRALGFGRGSILAAFLAESVALSLAGGAVGVALALFTPLLDFTTVNFATGTDVEFHFRPDPAALLTAVGVAVVVGILGGVLPAIRASRMHPVVAMRA